MLVVYTIEIADGEHDAPHSVYGLAGLRWRALLIWLIGLGQKIVNLHATHLQWCYPVCHSTTAYDISALFRSIWRPIASACPALLLYGRPNRPLHSHLAPEHAIIWVFADRTSVLLHQLRRRACAAQELTHGRRREPAGLAYLWRR